MKSDKNPIVVVPTKKLQRSGCCCLRIGSYCVATFVLSKVKKWWNQFFFWLVLAFAPACRLLRLKFTESGGWTDWLYRPKNRWLSSYSKFRFIHFRVADDWWASANCNSIQLNETLSFPQSSIQQQQWDSLPTSCSFSTCSSNSQRAWRRFWTKFHSLRNLMQQQENNWMRKSSICFKQRSKLVKLAL